jgi:hypothetical protein
MTTVNVRYMVDDVDSALALYTTGSHRSGLLARIVCPRLGRPQPDGYARVRRLAGTRLS